MCCLRKETPSTVNAWRSGRTLFPRIDKLRLVARVVGLRFALVPIAADIEDEVAAPVKRARKKAGSEARPTIN